MSYRTPIGHFHIGAKKIGRFGPCLEIHGKSADGYEQRGRYVEIHGSTRKLGVPASLGCVTVSYDVARQLYDTVSVGTPITIKL